MLGKIIQGRENLNQNNLMDKENVKELIKKVKEALNELVAEVEKEDEAA